jgi:hypothetical protein
MADDGRAAAAGRLAPVSLPTGALTVVGRLGLALATVPAPARYKLVIGIEGMPCENDWDVWVYPSAVDGTSPRGVMLATALDGPALAALEQGGTVMLTIPPGRVRGDARGDVALGFSSIFWNTAWTKRQAPHTLGILCDPKHPALAAFPTDYHSNWQWWYLIQGAGAMILDGLPRDLRPIVQVVDDWVTNRKLGLIFEARVGRGKVLVCSIDLASDQNPVSRQMRASLFRYVASPQFVPRVSLAAEQVRSLSKP